MSNHRTTAVAALAAAGVAFTAYPALRPYSDETTLDGAAAMASSAWVAAHSLGMVGFVALTLGVWALRRVGTAGARTGGTVVGLTWLGVSLVLPYYGAETFGVRVIAQRALDSGDAGLLELVEQFRYDVVALSFFGSGLLVLAAAGIGLAVWLRDARPTMRTGGLLVGAAMATYLPQFFLSPALRITHGVVLGIGCLLLAGAVRGANRPENGSSTDAAAEAGARGTVSTNA